MKRIFLPILLSLLSFQYAQAIIIPTPFITQTQYRWRNDDGNETTATWKAALNTATTMADTNSNIRLRIELNNNSGGGAYNINETLEYSANNGPWVPITNAPTNAFRYVTSPSLTHGAATTNQLGAATAATFIAGKIVSAVPIGATMSMDINKTEYEWVIRPTANALANTTYTFRSASQGSTPLVYPTLNSTCVNVYVASKTEADRCGTGTLSLGAIGSAGTTIKWFDAQTGGTELGSGASFTTPVISSTTTYWAAATVGTTCSSIRVPVVATIKPLPFVSLGPDASFCQENTFTMNPGNEFTAYLWDNGSTAQTRTVNLPGSYRVAVTDASGCQNRDTIVLTYYPKPIINLGNDTFICPNITITLDAGNPGMDFLWSTGATTQTIPANQTGSYSVKVVNQFNCANGDTMNLTIKDLPIGNINATYGSPATYTFDAGDAHFAVNYLWNFGDGSPQEQGYQVEHTYATNGIYTVSMTLVGDCGADAARTRTVDVFDARGTGINNPSLSSELSIYPNPATTVLTVATKAAIKFKKIEAYNILGQKVISEQAENEVLHQINIQALTPGIYSLKIETDKGFVTRKFEILK